MDFVFISMVFPIQMMVKFEMTLFEMIMYCSEILHTKMNHNKQDISARINAPGNTTHKQCDQMNIANKKHNYSNEGPACFKKKKKKKKKRRRRVKRHTNMLTQNNYLLIDTR